MGSNRALCEIRESVSFFDYCVNVAGSTNEWLEVRSIIDYYLARNPHVGRQIGSSVMYVITLRMNKHDYWLYYSFTDNPEMITLLELHEVK